MKALPVLLTALLAYLPVRAQVDSLNFNPRSDPAPTLGSGVDTSSGDSTAQVLPGNCYAAAEAEERTLFLRSAGTTPPAELSVRYCIGNDTLYDLVVLKDTGWNRVKHWPLIAGDTLCAELLDMSLTARWDFRSAGVEKVVQNEDFREFTGDIWYYKDVALLRISKTRDYPEKINIVVGLQPGFDLDQLFLSAKLIHPTEGVKEVEKEVRISEADELGSQNRLLRVFIPEWTLEQKGKYFLRISHQHLSDRLNGIDFISYELLTP